MQSASELKTRKRKLRKNPTPNETLFAARLSSAGIDYSHQIIIGSHIVDFVIPSKLLAIDLDGAGQDTQTINEERDAFISKAGFAVLHVHVNEAQSFDVEAIVSLPDSPVTAYRSALARAVAYRGVAMQRAKLAS